MNIKVGFIGFGLIGGSIARALKKSDSSIYMMVYSRSINPLMQAKKDGVIDEITREDNISLSGASESLNSTKFKRVDVDYATKTNRDGYEKIFDIPSGISKIRIYIWIEGQDVDCENEASVGDAKLTLKLSTNPS